MHIPDGLMSPEVLIIGWVCALVGLSISLKALKSMPDKQIVVMGVLSAGIFAAQMLNFPVFGGTSGHLLGAALATIMLGPASAMVILSSILIVQCLLFGDGGITALGLNILNMALIGSLVSYYSNALLRRKNDKSAYSRRSAFAAAWLSTFAASLACATELSVSSLISPSYGIVWNIALPFMAFYHALIATGEGMITVGILEYVSRVSPDMLDMIKIDLRGRKIEC